MCYECRKPGHINPDCPLVKRKKGKTKKKVSALKPEMWSDAECESSDDDADQVNICLMTDFNVEEELR